MKGVQAVSALQLLETMQSQELTPNVIAYNAAITACANAGQSVAAVQFPETMQSQELTPTVIAHSSVKSKVGSLPLPRGAFPTQPHRTPRATQHLALQMGTW